jgi:hypothetical protein
VIAETSVSVFDSWSSNYWLVLVVKVGLVIVLYLTTFLIVSYREHKGESDPHRAGVAERRRARRPQRAPVRLDQRRDAPHECGLSGAVGPEHGKDHALLATSSSPSRARVFPKR